MDTTGQPAVPAYSCDQAPGDALAAFVDANPTDATANFTLNGAANTQGDILADFSLRGPDPAPYQDITKPDITGPGVLVYAAFPINLGAYGTISGTSMSTPHATGSAALVRKVHPDWTVSETKSALMMTAFNGGTKEDGVTPWDADDVGNGRLDLTKAALAGLVMDETTQHYVDANPNTGGDPKTLNIPTVRNMDCTPNCTWTRTVRNTRTEATSWSGFRHRDYAGLRYRGFTEQLCLRRRPWRNTRAHDYSDADNRPNHCRGVRRGGAAREWRRFPR